MSCPFCQLDSTKYYNEIIEETKNFRIIPGLGALTPGYILILPKKHCYSMTNFNAELMLEYQNIIHKYRKLFKSIYHKYPIIFEHGTPDPCGLCASCVIHAHTHIINHHYQNEEAIIQQLNFQKINNLTEIKKDQNYIYYQNHQGQEYITYNFEPISQIMRIFIAQDLNIKDQYDWRAFPFENNIHQTINDLKNKLK